MKSFTIRGDLPAFPVTTGVAYSIVSHDNDNGPHSRQTVFERAASWIVHSSLHHEFFVCGMADIARIALSRLEREGGTLLARHAGTELRFSESQRDMRSRNMGHNCAIIRAVLKKNLLKKSLLFASQEINKGERVLNLDNYTFYACWKRETLLYQTLDRDEQSQRRLAEQSSKSKLWKTIEIPFFITLVHALRLTQHPSRT